MRKTALGTKPDRQYKSTFTSATTEYEKLTNSFSISVSDWRDETEHAEERPVEVTFCK